jgi:hypothetical protein
MHALLDQVPQHGTITLSVVRTDDSATAAAVSTAATAAAAAAATPHSKVDSVPRLPAAVGAGFYSYILM